jgi:hypothetical protein
VLHYDVIQQYRPQSLRVVDAFKADYDKIPPGECNCSTCRELRGLKPLPTIRSRYRDNVESTKRLYASVKTWVSRNLRREP